MTSFLEGRVALHPGDCLEVMKGLADNSIDAVVTDPPYHLTTGKKGGTGEASLNLNSPAGRARVSTGGFMGKQWDGGDLAQDPALWFAVLRVLKPGGHVAAFSGTRTYHRMACAIEDAGFEIRDQLAWVYGQGFPKSHDVSKGIDRAAGAEREVIGPNRWAARVPNGTVGVRGNEFGKPDETVPATDAARQWQGWGTALKPAWEPICLARKPLSEPTIAANVLRWGTGAINVDACRVEGTKDVPASPRRAPQSSAYGDLSKDPGTGSGWQRNVGRWPANLAHDGSQEVLDVFPETGPSHPPCNEGSVRSNKIYGIDDRGRTFHPGFPDENRSAARFFYTAKANSDNRIGSKHPTVKPLDLMQWLVRLIAPPGGVVLDPFAGSGTTGEAAWREGFRAILVEREAEYCADIERRMVHVLKSQRERKQTVITARGQMESAGPLFE